MSYLMMFEQSLLICSVSAFTTFKHDINMRLYVSVQILRMFVSLSTPARETFKQTLRQMHMAMVCNPTF